jgi:hypothetical protein
MYLHVQLTHSHLSVKYLNSYRYTRNKSTTVQSAAAPCGCAVQIPQDLYMN